MATLQSSRFYTVSIGSHTLRFWGTEQHAHRVAARWIRIFWARANLQPERWSFELPQHTAPEVTITRHSLTEARGFSGSGRAAHGAHAWTRSHEVRA